MTKTIHQNRLSIDVSPEEHRLIKINAILHNQTIREYVLEAIKRTLEEEDENKDMYSMTTNMGYVLKELWDNKKDAMYNKL